MATQRSKNRQQELFWPRVVMRKWLNISARDSDFSADTDDEEGDLDDDSDTEEFAQSRFRLPKEVEAQDDPNGTSEAFPIIRRRRNSETFRTQYINTKEVRICVGTWNVGGKFPPDDLDIDDWIDMNEPADIYVLGLQEIVPLNAGNIFGAEDSRPVSKWENIIRNTLNRVRPSTAKVKSFSDPPSPSKFKPSEDIPEIEEEMMLESDSDVGEEIYPLDDENDSFDDDKPDNMFTNYEAFTCTDSVEPDMPAEKSLQKQFSSSRRLDRLNCLRTEDNEGDVETPTKQYSGRLTKMLSGSERIGLSWPEPPLNMLTQNVLERPNSFKTVKSFKMSKSFRTYSSFKSTANDRSSGLALLAELDIETLMKRKRRSSYVRMVSKQMVGVFLTIWVRKSLRRHIQNVGVSTVGVGVMGYIGNKGSISVSMSIYQTLFCFICTHLTSGEKDGDELKRNADVQEIHRRTHFHSQLHGFPKSIYDHERIIWLGDLNYRINLSYDKTRELIFRKQWSKLAERDQLLRELRKGRAFGGWSEGTLDFAPTYKYDLNSEKYYGEDPKAGRRNPAWCDRILSYGKGIRLLRYRRSELKLSDHRPVTATYMAEVEVFSSRKLQKALTFTDAEIDQHDVIAEMGIDVGTGRLRLEKGIWEQ